MAVKLKFQYEGKDGFVWIQQTTKVRITQISSIGQFFFVKVVVRAKNVGELLQQQKGKVLLVESGNGAL